MGSGITKPIDGVDSSGSVSSVDNEQYNDELEQTDLEKELVIMNSITNTHFTDPQIPLDSTVNNSLALISSSSSRSSVEVHLSKWFEQTAGLEHVTAEVFAKIMFDQGYSSPMKIVNAYIQDKNFFRQYRCIDNNDVKCILNTSLFQAYTASTDTFHPLNEESDDNMELLNERYRQMISDENELFQDLIQQQVNIDNATRDMMLQQNLQDDRNRRMIEETQYEMMEMLDYAMKMSLMDTGRFHEDDGSMSEPLDWFDHANNEIYPPLSSLIGNFSYTNSEEKTKKIITKWDPQYSSPLLDYAYNFSSAVRRGTIGSQPAVMCPINSTESCITIRLDEAPKRYNFFSFGFAIWNTNSGMVTGLLNGTERCFGRTNLSWGIYDYRGNDKNAEIWSNGKLITTVRTLYEGDVLSIALNSRIGMACMYLNNNIICTYSTLDCSAQYIYGATICDDHKVTVISRDVPIPTKEQLCKLNGYEEINNNNNNNNSSSRIEAQAAAMAQTILSTVAAAGQQIAQQSNLGNNMTVPATPASVMLPILSRAQPKNIVQLSNEVKNTSCDEDDSCCICLDGKKSVVLLPCKHLCLCEKCNTSSLKNCPICRNVIETVIVTFRA